ncbi:unnamed protein product [Cylicocyclus nassatus]|uniref:Histone-lysine N-methyltransferase n=1 Tax=Cylicocyclus nassatus TaxID=53992 RepID=A0AA36GPD9_CYLNA|nr:unnamed protein product [Cylicocyclus nassatus]
MSYEAVPCMFRSSAQNGNGETQYLGLLIRPSANQQNPPGAPAGTVVGRPNTGQPVTALASGGTPAKAPPQPLLVQGVYPQGAPIVVQGETPKVLVPAKVQVRLQQGGDASVAISPTALPSTTLPMAATSTMAWPQAGPVKAAFAPPVHNLASPCNSQPRSLSVCSASPQLDSSPMSPLPNIIQYHNHPAPSVVRPGLQADPRSVRVSNAGPWTAPVSDSSTTPDSGIQSVPGSPPSNHPLTPPTMQLEGCDSVCEERYENDEDFADMPRLLPADQEEEPQCSNSCTSIREDVTSAHGSECETAPTPSISITTTMDTKEIVEQLIMLDPQKANVIANLIKRRQSSNKRRSGSKQEHAPKRARPASAASEDAKKSEEEPTPVRVSTRSTSRASSLKDGRTSSCANMKLEVSPVCIDGTSGIVSQEISPLPRVQNPSESPSSEERKSDANSSTDELEIRKLYREAVKRMLREKVTTLLEATISDLQGLRIGPRERHDRRNSKERKNLWAVNWEHVKKRRKKEKEEDKKKSSERTRKKEVFSKRQEKQQNKHEHVEEKHEDAEDHPHPEKNNEKRTRKRRNDSMEKEKEKEKEKSKDEHRTRSSHSTPARRTSCCETTTPTKKMTCCDNTTLKREKEYEEIVRSVAVGTLPEWESPVLSCGCTRGACTSDSECVNRALCVQCPPGCAAPLCANKKFWKDDALKSLVVGGAKTRKILRTKHARRAGDFLGEFAGEVVRFEDARKRWETYSKTDTSPIILCLTSRLFVDATVRGNVTRYVRHSCKPNARLEVWSVNGNYRSGLFALGDIASGSEITIDMNGLLPATRKCHCGAHDCRKKIVMSRNAPIASATDLSINEERIVRKEHLFLIRNRQHCIAQAISSGIHGSFEAPTSQIDGLRKILNGIGYRVRRIDGRLPMKSLAGYHRLCRILQSVERRRPQLSKAEIATAFDAEMTKWLDEIADDDLDRAYTALRGRYLFDGGKSDKEEKQKKDRRRDGRIMSREMNLEYIDSAFKVGGYDPDAVWPEGKANEKDDAVRCVCGSLEEDGEMTLCDTCNFWLHSECLQDVDPDADEYKCQFCCGTISGNRPSSDVVLAKQPEIRLYACTYYKALVNNRSIQVRLNETVHVKRTAGDDHKKILKKLMDVSEKKKKNGEEERFEDIPPANNTRLPSETFHRKDLRVFRVERLFTAPGGHRFVFGFYYARPHETFCDSQRIFHRNEVFATPLYDTLPLDAVVGRCAVLDPSVWCIGRPTVPEFKEADVYLCEYHIDRNQRSFEKIPSKNRYPINTQPYVFRKFDEPITIKRDFTPFIVDPTSSSPAKSSAKMDKNASEAALLKRIKSHNLDAVLSKIGHSGKRASIPSKDGEKKEKRHRKVNNK